MKFKRYKRITEILTKSEFRNPEYRDTVKQTFSKEDWAKSYPFVRSLFKSLSPDGTFKKTLVFDLNSNSEGTPLDKGVILDIKKLLTSKGYSVDDVLFQSGLATKTNRGDTKIIQVVEATLNDLKNFQKKEDIKDKLIKQLEDEVFMAKLPQGSAESKQKQIDEIIAEKEYLNNLSPSLNEYIAFLKNKGKTSNYKLVFTLDTTAFASQSTKTAWRSCMNLDGGVNKHYLGKSLSNGAFVVFLALDEDIATLNAPVARVLVKPFKNESGEVYWYVDNVYPQGGYPKFRQKVTEILTSHNMNVSEGQYSLDTNKHYHDSESEAIVDEVFKYVQKGDYSDLQSKPKEFIETMFSRYPKQVVLNWDMEIPFPNIEIDTLDLSNTDIRKLPKGIKAKNINLSNTNIERIF